MTKHSDIPMRSEYTVDERKAMADYMRGLRKCYRYQSHVSRMAVKWVRIGFYATILICIAYLLRGCGSEAWAYVPLEYTDTQYVNAIYMAEGGKNAKYAYGIRSVIYKTREKARNICFTTIKHNRSRFIRYGHRHYPRFIDFLASRYCPTTGRNLTQSERKLNKYWVKNVEYWLKRG